MLAVGKPKLLNKNAEIFCNSFKVFPVQMENPEQYELII